MRSNKSIIIGAVVGIVIIAAGFISWWYFSNTKQAESDQALQKRQQAETDAISTLNNDVGGYNTQDGFTISYMETEQIFSITITKNPFEKYKANALAWMKDNGLNPQNTQYICFVTQDVTVTDDQINRCGTANIK